MARGVRRLFVQFLWEIFEVGEGRTGLGGEAVFFLNSGVNFVAEDLDISGRPNANFDLVVFYINNGDFNFVSDHYGLVDSAGKNKHQEVPERARSLTPFFSAISLRIKCLVFQRESV